jgi:hypothetical protein
VIEGQRLSAHQRVAGATLVDLDLDLATQEHDSEGQRLDRSRQSRAEPKPVAMVAHAAQSLHCRKPRPRERAQVHAIADVALQVMQIQERRLREVGVRQLEVTDLRGDH